MTSCLLLLPFTLVLVAADPSPEPESPAQEDQRRMQGTWTIEKLVKRGKAGKDTTNVKVVIEKDRLTIREPKRDEVALFVLRADKRPRQIDILPQREGAVKLPANRKVEGIYKLAGDELTLCYRPVGKGRPTEFDDPDTILMVLKREKK